MNDRHKIDWEATEREYRAGRRSLRDIADEFGCSEGAIRKRAGKEGWTRDIAAKVQQKAEELVRKAEVRKEVRTASIITERTTIEVTAQMLADKVLGQREDVKRARGIINKLFSEVESECDNKADFALIGELLANPDDNGKDRLNDLYRAAISLPERVKSAKALSDALKVLVELERKVLRIDDQSPVEPTPTNNQAPGGSITIEAVTALMAKMAEAKASG